MDKVVSTLIFASAAVALAVVLTVYYSSFFRLFMRYEELMFDYAYATIKDDQAEIVIRFK
jgi:hypothetical protein